MNNLNYPFVSCICPTYNRAKFLPYLLHIFDIQEWPKKQRELIILDDSPTNNEDIINANKKDNNVRYIYSKKKIQLGKKRNMLNKYAKGEYIICFDDDDYYPPTRIKHTIQKMRATKNILAGSSILYLYMACLDKIYIFGPYGENHCTNGTMAYHKSFLKDNSYNNNADKAEEKYFLKDYTCPLVQLDPINTILVMSHDSNTVDKRKMLNTAKETSMKLKNFIKDKKLLNFYKLLAEETKKYPMQQIPIMKFEDIKINSFDLEAIEAGYILISKQTIEIEIKKIKNQPFKQPIINRFENIIKKIENKELKELDSSNQKILNLDDVICGNIKISKDYVNYIINMLSKEEKKDIKIINKLKEIQQLQTEEKLESNIITALNEYIYFNSNTEQSEKRALEKTKNIPLEEPKNIPLEETKNILLEQSEKRALNIDDIINNKIKLSKNQIIDILEFLNYLNLNDEIKEKISILQIMIELNIFDNIQYANNFNLNNYDSIILDNNNKYYFNNELISLNDILIGKINISKNDLELINKVILQNKNKDTSYILNLIKKITKYNILKYGKVDILHNCKKILIFKKIYLFEFKDDNNNDILEEKSLNLDDIIINKITISKYLLDILDNLKNYSQNLDNILRKKIKIIMDKYNKNLLTFSNENDINNYKRLNNNENNYFTISQNIKSDNLIIEISNLNIDDLINSEVKISKKDIYEIFNILTISTNDELNNKIEILKEFEGFNILQYDEDNKLSNYDNLITPSGYIYKLKNYNNASDNIINNKIDNITKN